MRLSLIIVLVCTLAVFNFDTVCSAQQITLDSLFAIAKKSLNENNYSKAIELYQNCLKESQKQNDFTKIGTAYIGVGIAYDKSGIYDSSLSNYFKALKNYEIAKNEKKQAGTLKNIGNTYRIIRSYDKSHDFLQQALIKFQKINDSTGMANVFNDIGLTYMDEHNNTEAINHFKKVIYQYNKYATEEVKAFAFNNIAIIYSNIGKYDESFNNYSHSLQLMQQQNNQYGVALTLGDLGDLFNKKGSYTKSLEYSKQSLSISEKIVSKELMANAYRNLADCYTHLGDFKQAFIFLNKQMNVKDSIFKEQSARSYAEMETRYETEKKQKEIRLLELENNLKNIAITNQRRTFYLFLIVLAFILIIAVLLYRSYRIKQKANTALGLLNNKLNEANASKVKLLSILSHDLRSPVSNLFSFLQLQKQSPHRLTKEEQNEHGKQVSVAAENLLDAMEDLLIWTKSQMDNFNPADEEVNLFYFFDEIINLNSTAAANKNIQLLKDCPPNLSFCTDTNFLRIILRNLTSNAIKFTPENGTIHLIASKQNKTLTISVRDNGPGITPEHIQSIFEWNSIRSDSSGLGLKLAKEFTEKLNGVISVESQLGKGAEFQLVFPLHEE